MITDVTMKEGLQKHSTRPGEMFPDKTIYFGFESCFKNMNVLFLVSNTFCTSVGVGGTFHGVRGIFVALIPSLHQLKLVVLDDLVCDFV